MSENLFAVHLTNGQGREDVVPGTLAKDSAGDQWSVPVPLGPKTLRCC